MKDEITYEDEMPQEDKYDKILKKAFFKYLFSKDIKLKLTSNKSLIFSLYAISTRQLQLRFISLIPELKLRKPLSKKILIFNIGWIFGFLGISFQLKSENDLTDIRNEVNDLIKTMEF